MGDRVTVKYRPGSIRGRWWALVSLCAGTSLLELVLLAVFDPTARPQLAPQTNAIAPFGVFGDLRWLSVYNTSWAALAGEAAALMVVRTTMTALSVHLAWPAHVARPGAARLLTRSAVATVLSAALLLPSVVVLFGAAVVPVSWLFLAGVPAALLVAVVLHPVGISGDWWRRALPPRGVAWVALSFLALSMSGSVIGVLPAPFWPLVCILSGLFNAWAWVGAVHAVVDRRAPRFTLPLVPVAIVGLAVVVVAGTTMGFDRARPTTAAAAGAGVVQAGGGAGPRHDPPLLLVSGYGSTWDGAASHPVPGPFYEVRFSYHGLSRTGAPLPYGSADTVKSLAVLDRMFLAQVDALAWRSGRPVAVVAESEGAMVAKTALLASPGAPVDRLVLASPLEAPGRVMYPAAGQDQGWGLATGQALVVLDRALEGISPVDLSPHSAFLSSLDSAAPLLAGAMSCPLRDVRQFALVPLADATVTGASVLPFPTVVLAAFHGGLVESPQGARDVADLLLSRPVRGDRLLRTAETTISYASGAWQVPSLSPSAFARYGHAGGEASCAQLAAHLSVDLRRPR